jgi:hypothetical protein
MGDKDWRLFLLAERVGLLLGCLRNFRRSGDQADLDGALSLEPQVAELLADAREVLPRPE